MSCFFSVRSYDPVITPQIACGDAVELKLELGSDGVYRTNKGRANGTYLVNYALPTLRCENAAVSAIPPEQLVRSQSTKDDSCGARIWPMCRGRAVAYTTYTSRSKIQRESKTLTPRMRNYSDGGITSVRTRSITVLLGYMIASTADLAA